MNKENITQEQIDLWKQQFESVFKVQIEDKVAYLRSPNRKELSYASKLGGQDPFGFNEHILKCCWLDGDKEIQEKDSFFMALSGKLDKIIEIKEAKLEKL